MGISDLTLPMVLTVIIGIFLGSLMDGIAGGGGIITVPTYLLAGLPVHMALGTNKQSSIFGALLATYRYQKWKLIDWKLGLPAAALGLIGSYLGTRLQLRLDEKYLKYLLLIILPLVAFLVLRKKSMEDEPDPIDSAKRNLIVWTGAFVLGAYDGFYGPGVGTFMLIVFGKLARLDIRHASATLKLVNLCSNLASLGTSLLAGKVFVVLGMIGGVVSLCGQYIGVSLAFKNGVKIIRPVILLVMMLMIVKVCSELF